MIANKAVKIFVEPDEEIVFIVEKIINADTGRVILIVPNTAALISSVVSLKILSRQMLKYDRLVVLVSDTDLAKNLGEKASLTVCRKISDVSKETWQFAQELKEKYQDEIDRVKKELLSMRQEAPGDPLRVEDFLEKVIPGRNEMKAAGDKAYGLDTSDAPVISKLEKVKAVIVEDPEPPKAVVKTRLKERVVDLNGIKLYAGGDILNNKELLELERRHNNEVLEINLETEDNSASEFQDTDMYKSSGLVGVDMTKQLNESKYMSSGHKPFTAVKPNPLNKVSKFFTNLFKYVSISKLVGGAVVAIVIFLVVSYFFFASVKVQVKLASASFSVKKTVTAKVGDKNAYDTVALIVSANSVVKDATTSSEAATTGDGTTGEYAQGDLLIYNPTANDVVLKAGQVFIYNYGSTPLKYKTLTDVTIPAAAPKTAKVTVKAESHGENYNIASTLKSFLAEGNTSITSQNITTITGGTTVATKVLSKTDIEDLKASMIEQLKTQLLTNLKTVLGADDVLLEGSQKFVENSFTTSVKEGAATDKFTADLKMTVSAIIVSKEEVKKLLTDVAMLENGYSKVEMNDPIVENPKITDKIATFDVKANAVGMTLVDAETIKNEIKGKSVTEAKDFIKAKTGVESVIVEFSPPYIPLAIQKIPSEDNKLSVTVTGGTSTAK